jgi:hypothetical protein
MNMVFICVVAARLLVPLSIPKYPVPGIIGAFLVDAVDQTIFQTFGGLPRNYEAYDKALDLYYLVIAYTSTLRNWTDPSAFLIGRFLWYYRLIGTVAFELSGVNALLLVFPNTFEYFFMAYEIVRVRWRPDRLSRHALLGLAAFIWIVIKLPQEYWIHVADLDFTDESGRHAWLLPTVIAFLLVVLGAVVAVWPRLPARDWKPTFAVDAHRPHWEVAGPSPRAVLRTPLWSSLAEKVVLIGLISVVFAHVLNAQATAPQIACGVAGFVIVNAGVSHAFVVRGHRWHTAVTQFASMAGINVGAVVTFVLIRRQLHADLNLRNTLFLVLLMSLLVTLYDRYRTMQERRIHHAERMSRLHPVKEGRPLRPSGRQLAKRTS